MGSKSKTDKDEIESTTNNRSGTKALPPNMREPKKKENARDMISMSIFSFVADDIEKVYGKDLDLP